MKEMDIVDVKIEQINDHLAAIEARCSRLVLFVEGAPNEPGLSHSVPMLAREVESLRRCIDEHTRTIKIMNDMLTEIATEHRAIKRLTLTAIGAAIVAFVNSVFSVFGGKHP